MQAFFVVSRTTELSLKSLIAGSLAVQEHFHTMPCSADLNFAVNIEKGKKFTIYMAIASVEKTQGWKADYTLRKKETQRKK